MQTLTFLKFSAGGIVHDMNVAYTPTGAGVWVHAAVHDEQGGRTNHVRKLPLNAVEAVVTFTKVINGVSVPAELPPGWWYELGVI